MRRGLSLPTPSHRSSVYPAACHHGGGGSWRLPDHRPSRVCARPKGDRGCQPPKSSHTRADGEGLPCARATMSPTHLSCADRAPLEPEREAALCPWGVMPARSRGVAMWNYKRGPCQERKGQGALLGHIWGPESRRAVSADPGKVTFKLRSHVCMCTHVYTRVCWEEGHDARAQ